ncbi:MAG: Riboflavin synthase alpha chain [Candelina mexicana]|nr:MAG: Riboflavin synthase alpha chain [Candelina mexicana]
MGGHFMQGHVDTVATILSMTPDGNSPVFRIQPRDRSVLRYIVENGYVTLDGASITITRFQDGENRWWEVMLIAYTQEKVVTAAKEKGEDVNIEVDMVGKYVEKSADGGGVLEKMVHQYIDERLKTNGR